MSICNECWGKGWIKKQGVQFDCRKCKGTGVIENEPQNNGKWFCTLSTEEKATFLASNKMLNFDYQMWIEWLKEKHNA